MSLPVAQREVIEDTKVLSCGLVVRYRMNGNGHRYFTILEHGAEVCAGKFWWGKEKPMQVRSGDLPTGVTESEIVSRSYDVYRMATAAHS